MPPKAKGKGKAGAKTKTIEKKKDKIVEDKTFGLKNKKKSKVVQKYIAEVTKRVKGPHRPGGEVEAKKAAEKKAKLEAAKAKREMEMLFRATIKQPPVPPGVDPKSVVCELFRKGVCNKGDKCKYSHDLSVAKRGAKIDLHTDKRSLKEADSMEKWDQKKLEQVVKTKHGGQKGPKPTSIVCKFFLDAIEKELYGWFWVCPAGGENCKYKHALPPGYVFKTKKQRELEQEAKLNNENTGPSIVELIEEERAKLDSSKLTPVTFESFMEWKKRQAEKKAKKEEEARKEAAKKSGGKGLNALSGRALFAYDPSLFEDDAEAGGGDDLLAMAGKAEDAEDGEGGVAGGGGGGGGPGPEETEGFVDKPAKDDAADDAAAVGAPKAAEPPKPPAAAPAPEAVPAAAVAAADASVFLEGDDDDLDDLSDDE